MSNFFVDSGSASADSLNVACKVGDVLVSMSNSMHNYIEHFSKGITEKKLELGIKIITRGMEIKAMHPCGSAATRKMPIMRVAM